MAEEQAPEHNISPSDRPSAAHVPPSPPLSPPPRRRWGVGLAVAAVVAAVGVFMVLPRMRKGDPGKDGPVIFADLTLIVSDRTEVSCVGAEKFDRYACGFMDNATRRQIDERDTLRPYMTTDRRVYLIPGLFLQPDIARRAQTESPNTPREQLRRFTAKCRLKKAGELHGFKLRWAETGAWGEPQNADIMTVLDCQIAG